jgi:hypothetical protein
MNVITYKQPINMIKIWNKMTDHIIAKNANKVWGTRDWMIPATKNIDGLSAACGEVGTASVCTKSGKKKFMEHWKSTILAHHVKALLTPDAQATIKIQENLFQWIDPLSNKIVADDRSILNEALKLMRPDVQMNVYAELAKIKAIKPVNHAYNIVKWHSAMESNCIAIEQKVPGAYHESQYIMDYIDASLTVNAKSFKAEVNIICNRYAETLTDGMQCTLVVRLSRRTTTCLMMGLGKEKLVERIKLLRSPLKLQNYKPNSKIKSSKLLL